MKMNRRKVLLGTGAAVFGAAGIGAGQSVLADDHNIPVKIAEVKPTEETVILENTGSETVDLGGYQLDWEHENDEDQTETFEEGVTIEPGQQLSVWSGFQSTRIDAVEADYQIADHDQGRINDSDPDVIALLSPEDELVATSDGYTSGGDNSSGDDSNSDSNSDTDSENDGNESSADSEDESSDSEENLDGDSNAESDSDDKEEVEAEDDDC